MGEEAAFGEGVVGVNIVEAFSEAVEVRGRIPSEVGKHEGTLIAFTITLATLEEVRKAELKLGYVVQVVWCCHSLFTSMSFSSPPGSHCTLPMIRIKDEKAKKNEQAYLFISARMNTRPGSDVSFFIFRLITCELRLLRQSLAALFGKG